VVADSYTDFLGAKRRAAPIAGFVTPAESLSGHLFPFQKAGVSWALRRGKAALFFDTGLGKTRCELEWAAKVVAETGGDVLILTPLAVAPQTAREAAKMGVPVTVCRSGEDVRPGVNITNYDRLHLFSPGAFAGIVLDESSILKSFTGATRKALTEFAATIPYRLCCTATPAPNDHTEIGTHAEFLGVMTRTEMLATYFCHDGGKTQDWRLKGHAVRDFWRWVASWALACRRPSDLSDAFSDAGYDLPPLNVVEHVTDSAGEAEDGRLFAVEAVTLTEQRGARRESLTDRVARLAAVVNAEPAEPWILWCDLNAEGDALTAAIPGAVQVTGSDSTEAKERALTDFAEGRVRVVVSKASICGHGLNWQHCARMGFVGVNHSWEGWYQAVRRCWRFGQTRPVTVHAVMSERELPVLRNLKRKEFDAAAMAEEMVSVMQEFTDLSDGGQTGRDGGETYGREVAQGRRFTLHRGDCVEALKEMEPDSVDFSIFSPPFASLYTYSNSERDMGNCRTHSEFYEHFRFAVAELFRVTKPGRLLSFHCMNLPTSKERDGYIGISDFRGELIRLFQDAGWIYHSEVCIWKDPVTAMQRTKAIGLLYKQLKKDSCLSRQGIADYLVTVRKPGENPDRVTKDPGEFPVSLWQNYASPVWMDINPSDTLQYRSAREHDDERHICPLQLEVIRRAVRLWTNPGDLVLSPFAGIGSEGVVSLEMDRRFVGVELKGSYYRQAAANLKAADGFGPQTTIFDFLEIEDVPMDDLELVK
jgi:hypothetical protein